MSSTRSLTTDSAGSGLQFHSLHNRYRRMSSEAVGPTGRSSTVAQVLERVLHGGFESGVEVFSHIWSLSFSCQIITRWSSRSKLRPARSRQRTERQGRGTRTATADELAHLLFGGFWPPSRPDGQNHGHAAAILGVFTVNSHQVPFL